MKTERKTYHFGLTLATDVQQPGFMSLVVIVSERPYYEGKPVPPGAEEKLHIENR